MRFLIKILLFPVTLALSILVLVSRFICSFSGVLLSILSFVAFVIGVLALVMLKQPSSALNAGIIAFITSPFGIPLLAEWLTDRLEDLNGAIQSI